MRVLHLQLSAMTIKKLQHFFQINPGKSSDDFVHRDSPITYYLLLSLSDQKYIQTNLETSTNVIPQLSKKYVLIHYLYQTTYTTWYLNLAP